MSIVISFMGPDRTGIVDELSRVVAAHGGNWEESRMARLAGRFAGILRVVAPYDQNEALVGALRAMDLQVLIDVDEEGGRPDRAEYGVSLTGADHPGIVQKLSAVLAGLDVNIESLESQIDEAPMTGEALFVAALNLSCDPSIEEGAIQEALESVAEDLVVDLTVQRRAS